MVEMVPVEQDTKRRAPEMVPVDAGRQVNTAGVQPTFTRENLQQLQIAPDITSFGERMGRGVMDVGQGLKQLYMMAVRPPEEAKAYTQEVNKEIAAYQERLGSKPGMDIARGLGSMAAQAPAMLIPGGQAALLPRLAAGALSGAVTGASEFSQEGTFADKGMQAAVGAVGGAALPEAMRGLARGVVGAGQSVAGGIRKITPSNVTNADILAAVQSTGRSFDPTFDVGKISNDVKDQLFKDAKEQLRVSGELDPMALVRVQDFKKLGIDPTKAQITRDPRQWQMERNLAQVAGVGDPLLQRYSQQPGQLISALEQVRPGQQMPAYEAGAQAMAAAGSRFQKSGTYGDLGRQIDEIYTAARNAPGSNAELPFDAYRSRILDTLDQFEDKIPSPVKKRIDQFGAEDGRPFTIKEAVKFREMLTQRAASADPEQAVALSTLKKNLDKFFIETAETSGDNAVEAINLFKQGIDASSARARAFQTPGLQSAIDEKVAAEDFIKSHVLGGKVDDLRKLKATLSRTDISPEQQAANLQAWENIRGQVVQNLIDKAAPSGEGFSQAAYRKAFSDLGAPTGKGNSKLEILFSPEEIGTLSTVRRVSEAAFAQPVSGGIAIENRSGTAAGLANLLGRIPVAKQIAEAATQAGQVGAVQQALAASPVQTAATATAQQALRDAAARVIGGGGFTPYAPASAAILQQLRERPQGGLLGQ